MRCPICENDLQDQINHASETGMWQFRISCVCGSYFLWRQGRLRLITYGDYSPSTVVSV